jgi:Reverse transcriptase (RNA-dependent DNA polymerase)
MKDPEWAATIAKEQSKFESNCCLAEVPDTVQHLVPIMWLFNIKTDGTTKTHLVGRGDTMITWVDFDPNAVYCVNVAASSIKLAFIIAAMDKLVMRGGDLVGAYLVTLANPDFPVYIKAPQGYHISEGCVMQAVGNLHGFPPAGQNFSKQFDKCTTESGYNNTSGDPKFFDKWIKGKPIIVIAHSDDFRWFGPPEPIRMGRPCRHIQPL